MKADLYTCTSVSLSPLAKRIIRKVGEEYTPQQAHDWMARHGKRTLQTVEERLALGWTEDQILRPIFFKSTTEERLRLFALLALTINHLQET